MPFIKKYSQELSEIVINNHIGLYVNEFTLDMGEEDLLRLMNCLVGPKAPADKKERKTKCLHIHQ